MYTCIVIYDAAGSESDETPLRVMLMRILAEQLGATVLTSRENGVQCVIQFPCV